MNLSGMPDIHHIYFSDLYVVHTPTAYDFTKNIFVSQHYSIVFEVKACANAHIGMLYTVHLYIYMYMYISNFNLFTNPLLIFILTILIS